MQASAEFALGINPRRVEVSLNKTLTCKKETHPDLMRKETRNWLETSEYDLNTAQHMLEAGRYIYVVF
ncbi:MAG TPA: hypothetical protein VI387_02070, partial [Candidatus Brocadiales bacterium]|nr:hypothetical protein [Candidatus Brocadiales bacterium]